MKNTNKKSKNNYSDDDIQDVLNNKEKIYNALHKNAKLVKFLKDVRVYIKLLYDIITAKVLNVPGGVIAAIIGALLFLISPLDIIPDWSPALGYMDDVFVLSLCHKLTKSFIDRYKCVMEILKRKGAA